MKYNIPSVQTMLQNYFLQRLMQQLKVSNQTVSSYRDTFRIYFEYLLNIHSVKATDAAIEHFNLEYVQSFCKYLEKNRKNKASTINNRLAAIRSFMQYISEVEPEYSSIAKRTLMLPMQKTETVTMEFISKEEFNAMISVCDTSSLIGSGDKLMLMILYNTGVRVSELLGIRCYDIQTSDVPGRMNIKIHGKGRKERIVPLWKDTAQYIRKYISFNGLEDNSFLFINKNGDKLTRSGVRSRISYITKQASSEAAGLCEKNVTPHTFRHSVAMNLLRSGIDISTIAIWLGHSSIETTHKYMAAYMEIKRKAMDKAGTAGDSYYSYTPSHDILSFLKSL